MAERSRAHVQSFHIQEGVGSIPGWAEFFFLEFLKAFMPEWDCPNYNQAAPLLPGTYYNGQILLFSKCDYCCCILLCNNSKEHSALRNGKNSAMTNRSSIVCFIDCKINSRSKFNVWNKMFSLAFETTPFEKISKSLWVQLPASLNCTFFGF